MSLSFRLASMILGGCGLFQAARCDSLTYTYTNLDLPGGASSINDLGQIVGKALPGGFLYSQGEITTITIPGPLTSLTGINNVGQMVGNSGGLGGSNGFLYNNGLFTFFHVGGYFTSAAGINNAGQIVGSFDGQGYVGSIGHFTTVDVPGAAYTFLSGINDNGAMVGDFEVPQGAGYAGHAFLDSQGVFTIIDFPGASVTYPSAINNLGQIVGYFIDAAGNPHAYVENGGEFIELNPPEATPGAMYLSFEATGINNAGEIVGNYVDSDYNVHTFLATPVPEASSLVLLAIGLVAAGLFRKWSLRH